MRVQEVLVKANYNNNFEDYTILKIKLDFENRTNPNLALFRLNQEYYNAHSWTTNDGHFEKYNDVIKEALINGYNKENEELINYLKGI